MFAVIEDGSRQYRVQEGDTLTIDYRAGSNAGDEVSFERVLLANGGGASIVGRPAIDGAVIQAEVVDPEVKGPKIEVQKIRRRKNSRRHTGHRQKFTSVRIKTISVPGLEVVTPQQDSQEQTPPTGDTSSDATEPSTSDSASAVSDEAAEDAAATEAGSKDDAAANDD